MFNFLIIERIFMKFVMMLTVLCSLVGLNAFAGDAASFKNLGFSGDGKYFAFAQVGVTDGAGFAYANVSVIDVAKNSVVRNKSVVLEDENSDVKLAFNKALALAKISQFGILAGKNTGSYLINRADSDLSKYSDSVFTSDANWQYPRYELSMELKTMPDETEGKWCSDMSNGGPKGFKLSLANQSEPERAAKVLQDDMNLPKSRGACVFDYSVRKVIKNGSAFVVIVSTLSVGFEGPDTRFLAVTANSVL